jgi:hypothetical protein
MVRRAERIFAAKRDAAVAAVAGFYVDFGFVNEHEKNPIRKRVKTVRMTLSGRAESSIEIGTTGVLRMTARLNGAAVSPSGSVQGNYGSSFCGEHFDFAREQCTD